MPILPKPRVDVEPREPGGEIGGGFQSYPVDEQVDEFAPAPVRIGIVFALPIEAEGTRLRMSGVRTIRTRDFVFHEGRYKGRTIFLVESGPGQKAAEEATLALLEGHRPDWVISAGFASGLDPDQRRLDLFMATSVANRSGERLSIDLHIDPEVLAETPGVHLGRLLTVDAPVRQPEEKRALADAEQAEALDTQSWGVANACRSERKRFMAIRVINDTVDEATPSEFDTLLRRRTIAGKLGAATGAIMRRPSSVKDMFFMRERAVAASGRLATYLTGVIVQLGP